MFDLALCSYIIGVIVSGFTCTIYIWWLIWILRKNRHLLNTEIRISISKPYIYDTLLFLGVFVSMSLTLYGRILLLTECVDQRDILIKSNLWAIRNWAIICPMALLGIRAFLRVKHSLPKD